MKHYPNLFRPLQLGDIEIKNRIWMAPLTRCRAVDNHLANDLMAEYYAQRAGAGLIIAEATMVIEGNSSFITEPGIYSESHAEAWKKVTSAVHEAGGKIALQLWHGGRACHPLLNNGATPVAPSALRITNDQVHTPEGKKDYVTPRALDVDEIPGIIDGFRKAAELAKMAEFDLVEVHGANGYLLDEFLRDGANKRDDIYGGTKENRARLILEVIDAVTEVWGSQKVGLRISPLNSYNSMIDSDPIGLATYLAESLNDKDLAYLHLMRSDFLGEQEGDVVNPVRETYRGTLVGNMGYSASESDQAIEKEQLDAVAFGTPFIGNPDLPERFALDAELNEAEPATFYTQGPEGYIDYPVLEKAEPAYT